MALRAPPIKDAEWFLRDVLLNLLAFVPLGAAIAWQRKGHWIVVAAVVGFGLGYGFETVQEVIPGRTSSAVHVLFNFVGAIVGAALALWVSKRVQESPSEAT